MEKIKNTKAVRSVAAISLCLALGLTSSGCNTGVTTVKSEKTKPTTEQINIQEIQTPNSKIYEPYEHVFYLRYDTLTQKNISKDVYGGQIVIPKGYEILEIENFNENFSNGSQTGGFDVWFINNKKVEVQPVYNEAIGGYDYSEPGKVIEMELEENNKTLSLTP